MRGSPIATVTLTLALGAAVLTACGSSSPAITDDASTQLQLQVQAVRDHAAALDRTAAEERLAELVQSVNDLRGRDEISADRADKVLSAASTVRAQLLTIPTTTTTTTTTPPPPPRDDEDDDDDDEKPPKENKGRGGGDGGRGSG